MGSSASSQQQCTSFDHTHYRRTTSPRPTHRLSPDQPQVLVAWSNHEQSGGAVTVDSPRDNDIMVCETCKANFNLLRRKNLCCDCKKHYCNACSAKEHKRCLTCVLFRSPLNRDLLRQLKIRDLRQYLNVHDVSTESCKEKGDLVELICNLLNSQSTSQGPTGLLQGSANISQNRSGGSGHGQPRPPAPAHRVPPGRPQGPQQQQRGPQQGGPQQAGFTNLQNTAERLYHQAHQQFFGAGTGTAESAGVVFRTGSTSVPQFGGRGQAAPPPEPQGPFAPSQEQYSSTTWTVQQQQQPTPPVPAQRGTTTTDTDTTPPVHSTEETSRPTTETDPQTNTAETNDDTVTSTDASAPKRRASLKDVTKPEDIEDLSVRQLKEILRANFVDYKGCVERYELQERVKRLFADREVIKAKEEKAINADGEDDGTGQLPSEDDLCRICMDATIDCVLLECGHMVTCTTCGKQMNECPICRQYVIRCVHIFRS